MARTPLPGREAVERRIDESLMGVSAGRGSVTVVEGAAGLGKTHLVLEAARRARLAGVVVADGRADEVRRLSPLSPLLEAMRGIIPIPPVLCDARLATTPTIDRGLRRLSERLTVLLRARARGQPMLVSLDDLQWADAATLLALQSMTDLAAARPVMWLLTRRPGPSTPRLDRTIAGMVARGATRVRLSPLSPDAVAVMAAGVLGAAPDRTLLGLLEKCAGSPSMVVELLRTLQEHNQLVVDMEHARLVSGGSSRHLYQPITQELTSLSPLTRQMLEVASAFGQYFDIRCVAHVLRRSVADMLPSIHEALGSELVVEEGTDLRFRCALVREAVYGALPITALRTLHREAADSVLAVRGSTDKAAQPRPQALNPVAHTDADRAQGAVGTVRLLHRPACWDRAWPLADTALDTALNKGLDDDQRQGHWAAAEAHTLAGHPAAAPARTRSALEPAARIGKRLAGQAHRPAFGWDSLTEAELRVARLAARALTNREIADQLRLSPHTVESHLRHAFRKLDIRSRVELTRAVLTHAAALEEDRSLDGRS